jgi:hypothetical protein
LENGTAGLGRFYNEKAMEEAVGIRDRADRKTLEALRTVLADKATDMALAGNRDAARGARENRGLRLPPASGAPDHRGHLVIDGDTKTRKELNVVDDVFCVHRSSPAAVVTGPIQAL